MKILFLDGSPKTADSTSVYLLKAMEQRLPDSDILWRSARNCDANALTEELDGCNAFMIAFPLYVDGLPSHLLRVLTQLQPLLAAGTWPGRVYGIINNGFYEAKQNQIAIDILKMWCRKSGLNWGQCVAVGGGGMAQTAPIGNGPCISIGKALDAIAANIMTGQQENDIFVEPDFPRFLYKSMAHIGWRTQAKQNGLRVKDIRRHFGST